MNILDQIRERREAAISGLPISQANNQEPHASVRSSRDVPKLLAVVDAVLRLHAPFEIGHAQGQQLKKVTVCEYCTCVVQEDRIYTYPCRTVAEINRALEGAS